MDGIPTIEQCVARARRRLWLDRAVAIWPWLAGGAPVIAAGVVALDRLRTGGTAVAAILGIAAAGSFLAAIAWAWMRRGDRLAAAVELDRRCRLDERVSSAIAVGSTAAGDTIAGAAVQADAQRALARVDPAAAFPISISWRQAWPLLPGLVALAAAWMATPRQPAAPSGDPQAASPHVAAATKALEQKLAEKEQRAAARQLPETERLLQTLAAETRRLSATPPLDPKETLVKLNDLAQQLEDRRRAIDELATIEKQWSHLRPKEPGPADDVARSLARGDFQTAAEQLDRLPEQLRLDALDKTEKQQLAKQLDEFRKPLDEPTKSERDSLDSSLTKMQQALGSAAEGLREGRDAAARAALDEVQRQLQSPAARQAEQKLLDEGLADVALCKASVRGGDGGKGGANDPSGRETAQSQPQVDQGSGGGKDAGGAKPGVGTDDGENFTLEKEKRLFDARLRAELGDAALRIIGAAEGPNTPGRAVEPTRPPSSAPADAAKSPPIRNPPLDPSRREQKRQYFDSLRESK